MSTYRLFEEEKWLVLTGVIGFFLSAGMAVAIILRGPVVFPEGNLQDAFSFNAAIGIFILSIAAILPLAGYKERNRKVMRRLLIGAALYAYGIETIQHFRGINPRFTQAGSVIDIAAGGIFGLVSLLLVILTVLLTIQFFRIKSDTLILATRYAFLSILAANIAGIWMIMLQDRFIGDSGNFIVLHGIGFHALQTLLLPGWLLQKSQASGRFKKTMVHVGGGAWMLAILLIGVQTGMGRSAFELAPFPVLAAASLLVWFGMTAGSIAIYLNKTKEIPAVEGN